MTKETLEWAGRTQYSRSLLLPKYQRIIQNLYEKANESSKQAGNRILTIEDLERKGTVISKIHEP